MSTPPVTQLEEPGRIPSSWHPFDASFGGHSRTLAQATWQSLPVARVRVISYEELREPNSYETVAQVRMTRAELAQRGIDLVAPVPEGTWDEAGPIQEAVVETDTGEQPLLIWHVAFEELPDHYQNVSPLELRAPISIPDAAAFVRATLDAFELPHDRAEWVVSPEDWPPYVGGHS